MENHDPGRLPYGGASEVYTGTAIKPCTAEATGAGLSPIDVTASLAYTDNIKVGTATANARWAGDDNHFNSAGSATFAITKAASYTVVTCTVGPFVYNGSAFTPCSAPVTGVGGLIQSLTVSYPDNTNTGTATASVLYMGDATRADGDWWEHATPMEGRWILAKVFDLPGNCTELEVKALGKREATGGTVDYWRFRTLITTCVISDVGPRLSQFLCNLSHL